MTNEHQTEKKNFNELQLLLAMVQLKDIEHHKQSNENSSTKIKPFLFWAGSKFHEIDNIKKLLPPGKRLVEPFVGSGSVFLNTDYDSYLLADVDQDIINIFQVLAEYQQEFIEAANQFFLQNPDDQEILRYYGHLIENKSTEKAIKANRINRACLFLYVNRSNVKCISSYEKQQKYKLYFPYDELNVCLDKINSCNVEFLAMDYQETLALAKAGDVIFCDPPTIAVTGRKYFFNIGKTTFTHSDYIRQEIRCAELRNKGIPCVFSHGQLTPLLIKNE